MRALGKTTTCMARAHILGAMAESMMENTTWTKSTVTASTIGQTAVDTKATGRMESSTARADTFYRLVS